MSRIFNIESSKDTSRSFALLAAALVFIFFDIRYKGIDLIFPDFLCYWIVARQCYLLSAIAPRFRRASRLANLLALFSLFSFLQCNLTLPEFQSFLRYTLASASGDYTHLLPAHFGEGNALINAWQTQSDLQTREIYFEATGLYTNQSVIHVRRYPSRESAENALIAIRDQESVQCSGYGGGYFLGLKYGRSDLMYSSQDKNVYVQRYEGARWWNPLTWKLAGIGWSDRELVIIESPQSLESKEPLDNRLVPLRTSRTFEGSHGFMKVDPMIPWGLLEILHWMFWLPTLLEGLARIAIRVDRTSLYPVLLRNIKLVYIGSFILFVSNFIIIFSGIVHTTLLLIATVLWFGMLYIITSSLLKVRNAILLHPLIHFEGPNLSRAENATNEI